VPWPLFCIGWDLPSAKIIREGAALREGATFWQVTQRRNASWDFLKPLVGTASLTVHNAKSRDRVYQANGIGVQGPGKEL
jgi:hypothetical protein